jgi:RES domain-containing protein
MKLWRIAAETRKYPATDLSGNAAAAHPGRWNEEQQPVVYTATTLAIAVLETASHIDDAGLPLNRFVVELTVPDDVWALHQALKLQDLSPSWASIPAGRASIEVGSAWLSSNQSPILLVPSVIVPEEYAALINPRHLAAAKIKATVVRLFEYNKLFRGGRF